MSKSVQNLTASRAAQRVARLVLTCASTWTAAYSAALAATLSPQSSTSTNTLKDIKPPVEIPSGWAWVWGVFGALLLAALLYFGWREWQRRRALVPVVPLVPAHIRAKQRLHEALALLAHPREFVIAVSDTLRWYLEQRFQFHAPERTTEEFLHELQSTQLLMAAQKDSLAEFLQRADLVKFAKYEPAEPELRELHAAALRLVEETEPVETTPALAQPQTIPGSTA
jgi:hypothetical protein